jgi:hypothetical protein
MTLETRMPSLRNHQKIIEEPSGWSISRVGDAMVQCSESFVVLRHKMGFEGV